MDDDEFYLEYAKLEWIRTAEAEANRFISLKKQ